MSFLREAEAWVDEVPLQTTPQRFGNKAFRDWLTRVEEVRELDSFNHVRVMLMNALYDSGTMDSKSRFFPLPPLPLLTRISLR